MIKFSIALLSSLLVGNLISFDVDNNSTRCEFNPTSPVRKVQLLRDFSDSTYVLYEMDQSYAIYLKDGMNEYFLEGSKKANSPFFGLSGNDLRYGGPGNYYYVNNGDVIDLLTKNTYEVKEFPKAPAISKESFESQKRPKLYSLNETSKFVPYGNLFSKMTNFPRNWFGECGLVALSMYLSYLDTAFNDDFIPNDREYYSYEYDKSEGRSDAEKLTPVSSKKESLTHKAHIAFKGDSSYDANAWESVPGTNYCLRDLLFDKYKHTLLGIGGTSGFPMAGLELRDTFNDYMKNESPSLYLSYQTSYATFPIPISNISLVTNFIDDRTPVILVMNSYNMVSPEDGQEAPYHHVVAYGYRGDNFICHMGWNPGTLKYTETYINSVWVHGYFAAKFQGEHKHSQNVSLNHYTGPVKVCADGHFTY